MVMKIGAIIWGLPESYDVSTHESLNNLLKPFASQQLKNLDITPQDTLWLTSKYNTNLVQTARTADEVSMVLDSKGNSQAQGSKDPREYIELFKAQEYTHLFILRLPFVITENHNLDNAILLMMSKNIDFMAQWSELNNEWDPSPLLINLNTATKQFMLHNRPLANISENNIRSTNWATYGFFQGPPSWVSEEYVDRLVSLCGPSKDADQDKIDAEILKKQLPESSILNEDFYQAFKDYYDWNIDA